MLLLPPFIQEGEDDARFYALIYYPGTYTSGPSGSKSVFLVLYFSTASNFTRFSDHIVDAGGHCYSYHRGFDHHDSPEYALLRGWNKYQVPPAHWRLFPNSSIPQDAWPEGTDDQESYLAARSRICQLLYPFRIHSHFSTPPSFHPDPDFAPPSILGPDPSEETKEIRREWHKRSH